MNFQTRAILMMGLASLARAEHDDYDIDDDAFEDYWDDHEDALEAARLGSHVQTAHGVLGCLAFALFFPMGAMLVRVLPGRFRARLHAAWQALAWCIALAVMGMGIWMAHGNEYLESHHAHIGLVACCGIAIQPLTGLLHHLRLRSVGRRTLVSYVHIWWGIPMITLGAVNGGFGMQLAGLSRTHMIVYGVFAAIVWLGWMVLSFLSQCLNRSRESPAPSDRKVSHDEPLVMRDATNNQPPARQKQQYA